LTIHYWSRSGLEEPTAPRPDPCLTDFARITPGESRLGGLQPHFRAVA
jgi:hypothetical protein